MIAAWQHTPASPSSLAAYFGELKTLLDAIPLERIEEIGARSTPPTGTTSRCSWSATAAAPRPRRTWPATSSKNTLAGNRPRFRVMSLTDNVALMSALANDVGYEHVFKEQLVNLIRTGDVLIVLSGSGNSPNVLEAMRYARKRSATVIAFLGFDGGEAAELADHAIVAPTDNYGLIEDVHLILNHALTSYFRGRLEGDPVEQ